MPASCASHGELSPTMRGEPSQSGKPPESALRKMTAAQLSGHDCSGLDSPLAHRSRVARLGGRVSNGGFIRAGIADGADGAETATLPHPLFPDHDDNAAADGASAELHATARHQHIHLAQHQHVHAATHSHHAAQASPQGGAPQEEGKAPRGRPSPRCCGAFGAIAAPSSPCSPGRRVSPYADVELLLDLPRRRRPPVRRR